MLRPHAMFDSRKLAKTYWPFGPFFGLSIEWKVEVIQRTLQIFMFTLVLRLEKVYGRKEYLELVTKLPNVSVGLLGSWRCDEILRGLICCCVFQEHLQQCLFESVQCTNDGCIDQIPRKDLKEHLSQHCKFREEMCQYCNKSVVLNNIKVRL